jgi:hypothetical protein
MTYNAWAAYRVPFIRCRILVPMSGGENICQTTQVLLNS